MPFYSRVDVGCLLAERYDNKSCVNLGGFRSQLQVSLMSRLTEVLWYNETVSLCMTIYIYIRFVWVLALSIHLLLFIWYFEMSVFMPSASSLCLPFAFVFLQVRHPQTARWFWNVFTSLKDICEMSFGFSVFRCRWEKRRCFQLGYELFYFHLTFSNTWLVLLTSIIFRIVSRLFIGVHRHLAFSYLI